MRHPLFLLLPFVLAATRLAFGIRPPSKYGVQPRIPAETENKALPVVIFCLTGLLITLGLMIRFPDLGAVIAEYNQF